MSERMLFVSRAPDNPAEKEEWARTMTRIQIAMWVDDGAICAECKGPYLTVDDFLARAPRVGNGVWKVFEDTFVDEACWEAYARRTQSVV